MTSPALHEVVGAIVRGDYDANLRTVIDAAAEREKALRKVACIMSSVTIGVGARVRITDEISPKYLRGLHGNVTHKHGDKFTIKLGAPAGRYGSVIKVDGDLIELRP